MIMSVITDKKIIDKIEKALTKIRPFLNEDGGDISLVEVTQDMVVKVKNYRALVVDVMLV